MNKRDVCIKLLNVLITNKIVFIRPSAIAEDSAEFRLSEIFKTLKAIVKDDVDHSENVIDLFESFAHTKDGGKTFPGMDLFKPSFLFEYDYDEDTICKLANDNSFVIPFDAYGKPLYDDHVHKELMLNVYNALIAAALYNRLNDCCQ